MNKKFIKFFVLSASLFFSFSLFDQSASAMTNEIQENVTQPTTVQSEAEKEQVNKKLELVDQYIKSKPKNLSRSYGSNVTVLFATCVQKYGTYCGPGAAYNATNAANSQDVFAKSLQTGPNGTAFPGNWAGTLNAWRPGNDYKCLSVPGGRYDTIFNWKKKLLDCIIYTIDNSYPVVADCHITTNSNTRIHPGYSYARDTWHYVTVGGYNDYANSDNSKILISDSHPSTSTIPRTYWTSLPKLAYATIDRGIVW
ncbi:C39 family peptidase [Clostridium botulinum]|uniref:C39 family peptidase n=1 Tax=Clostridium botulinum TaxID=1491 RepID=UPI001E2EE543|nr:C39 family peptidase [Clostridium botulinum]MCC5438046.1 C39 family peptidase [Clostridium botulinum]